MPLTCHITTVSHFWDPLCLCSKQVLMQNFSYKHEFDLHENEPTAHCKGRMHFHMDGFPWRQAKGNLVIVYWIISIPDSPVSSAVTSAVVLAAAFQLSAASLSCCCWSRNRACCCCCRNSFILFCSSFCFCCSICWRWCSCFRRASCCSCFLLRSSSCFLLASSCCFLGRRILRAYC